MARVRITFNINGREWTGEVDPNATLLEVIKGEVGLTGTKYGCGIGECGACTVIMNGKAVNSCLVLAPQADGARIETVEGLVREGKLHPLQEAFIEHHAVQCGYCTPGMLMSAKALLEENPDPTEEEIRIGISGNLCRCTGYEPIVKAIKAAAAKLDKSFQEE